MPAGAFFVQAKTPKVVTNHQTHLKTSPTMPAGFFCSEQNYKEHETITTKSLTMPAGAFVLKERR